MVKGKRGPHRPPLRLVSRHEQHPVARSPLTQEPPFDVLARCRPVAVDVLRAGVERAVIGVPEVPTPDTPVLREEEVAALVNAYRVEEDASDPPERL